jgi:hypothetical protein
VEITLRHNNGTVGYGWDNSLQSMNVEAVDLPFQGRAALPTGQSLVNRWSIRPSVPGHEILRP